MKEASLKRYICDSTIRYSGKDTFLAMVKKISSWQRFKDEGDTEQVKYKTFLKIMKQFCIATASMNKQY